MRVESQPNKGSCFSFPLSTKKWWLRSADALNAKNFPMRLFNRITLNKPN